MQLSFSKDFLPDNFPDQTYQKVNAATIIYLLRIVKTSQANYTFIFKRI